MINKVSILIIVLLPILGYSQNDTINQTDEDGQMQGYWIFYGADKPERGFPPEGRIEEGRLVNGRKEGMWKKYYPDGRTVKLEGEYKNNRPNGRYLKYFEDGSLRESGCFSFSDYGKDWPHKRFNSDGNIEYSSTMVDSHYIDSGFMYYPNKCLKSISVHCSDRKYEITLQFSDSVCNKLIKRDSISLFPPVFNTNKPIKYDSVNIQPLPTEQKAPNIEISYELKEKDSLSVEKNNWIISEHRKPKNENEEIIIHEVHSKGNLPMLDGYNKLYNTDDEIFIDAEFENGKLINGKIYVYDNDGILLKIKIYKKGSYHADGHL